MLIKAEQKYIRMSPRKIRLVVDSVRGIKLPQQVLLYLEHVNKRAAGVVSKLIKQAIANATNNLSLPADKLTIKELQVGGGPVYKRGQPVSRGRFHPVLKRTSHVRIVLESKERGGKNGKR
ncbi:MAG: 50S ribosomal protein L22 [Candidatus Blackburnbacteria bacterium]|nr:50S ribosomal protein L22 [Candidatus Blackburnbacteria bacterium]